MATNGAELPVAIQKAAVAMAASGQDAGSRTKPGAVEGRRGFCPGDERVGVDGRAHIASGERQRLPQVQARRQIIDRLLAA